MRRSPLHTARGAGPGPAPLRTAGLTALVGAVAGLLFLVPGARDWLAYDRAAIAAGEFWRLLTGHLVHWSLGHLVWDVGAFVLLGALCEARSRRRFLVCLAGSAVVIPAAVWWVMPGLEFYGGLSGVDSALFALLGVDLLRDELRRRSRAALAIGVGLSLGFALKIAFEFVTGATVFVADLSHGIAPVPVAHLAGAAIGILSAALAGGAEGSRFTGASRALSCRGET